MVPLLLACLGGVTPHHVRPVARVRPADAHWATGPSLPEPLLESRAAVLRGQIYVAGGIDRNGNPSAHVYRFDPATAKWDRVADLPAARHHMPLAVVGDVLYALGGFSGKDFRTERTVWAYLPNGTWAPRAPLSRPRAASAAVSIGGRIVVLGGVERLVDGGMADLTPIYDPTIDSWHDGWPILTRRDHLTAEAVHDFVYAIGGRLLNPDHNLATVEIYDAKNDRWGVKTPMLSATGALGSAVLDGKIHTFGGESRYAVFAEHEVYDPATNEWTMAAPLPTPRHGVAVAAVDGKIYVIGGGVRPGFSETDIVEVFTP